MKTSELVLIHLPSLTLNVEFKKGQLNLLVGNNGAGKTSLLLALLGEPVVKSGTIDFPSVDKLAFLPQEPIFPDHLRVRDLLKLAALGKPPAEDKIEEELSFFRLKALENRSLGDLSSGERQKAFLARTLLQPCQVILLDEPTNHLDADVTDLLWDRLSRLPSQGKEVIASTHDRVVLKSDRFHKILISAS